MLEMTRRIMLAGTLASAPAWPLQQDFPDMKLENLVACVRHALELTETDAWLVGQRLIWSTGGPRQLVIGVGAAVRASGLMLNGIFGASHRLPDGAVFALYDGGSAAGTWRPVADGTVTLCGIRMSAFAGRGRTGCLVQPREARIPTEIVLNG